MFIINYDPTKYGKVQTFFNLDIKLLQLTSSEVNVDEMFKVQPQDVLMYFMASGVILYDLRGYYCFFNK